ncbi:hypothetical protein KILIM_052_00420 [Kineosphaera limosa NBRC 100340]|uniref:Oxidoreductase molybdopterin-binding domain-containing protein n=1 Tax=Kineosphaera limosa NBRC 100340 TaxID=1184609 RepID=K6XDP5_9MICO|nr:hypothetical protein KILIM_052_00420 [Kineosphaera limosa NBRC 100340]
MDHDDSPGDGSGERSSDSGHPHPLPPGQRLVEARRPNHYGRVPRVDLQTWRLTISGATADGAEHRLSWGELGELPRTEFVADHHCASRRTLADVHWAGVGCRDLLERFPPAQTAPYALAYASYGYHSNVTVDDLLAPQALLATHMNGQPLAPEHGWPLRLILPHLYGWKGPKWLVALEFHHEPRRGFWEQRGHHFTGDVWREERFAHQE